MKKKNKGITLIALVITIIILLILAGISIASLTGSGLFENAKLASDKYSEESAKERLTTELNNLAMDKVIDSTYNKDDYVTNKLLENGFVVNGDIVIVDGYQFMIDREKLEITVTIGKCTENPNINIQVTNRELIDYSSKCILTIEIEYEKEIEKIIIDGKEKDIPQKENGKYTITETITKNGIHTIFVKDNNDGYNMESINITDIIEALEIYTVDDLIKFRESVKEGTTYEQRAVALKENLKLGSICYKVDGTTENDISWEPIADWSMENAGTFSGLFDGENHTISELYINTDSNFNGLFGQNSGIIKNLNVSGTVKANSGRTAIVCGDNSGTIENVTTLEGSTVEATGNSGGICGWSTGSISECENNSTVIVNGANVGGVCGYSSGIIYASRNKAQITGINYTGGVCGQTAANIIACKNEANVNGQNGSYVGGVVGLIGDSVRVIGCANTKNITSTGNIIGGVVGGGTWQTRSYVYNCYNTGDVSGKAKAGGIIGEIGHNALETISSKRTKVTNSYNNGKITGTTINDVWNGAGGIVASARSVDVNYCCNLNSAITRSR